MATGQFLDGDDWQDMLQDLLLPGHRVRSGHLDGTDVYYGEAIEDITEGMAIAIIDGADVTIKRATHVDGKVSGIATVSCLAGQRCEYAARGFVFVESWELIIGSVRLTASLTYFLDYNGQLSSTPPTVGYVIPMGQAQSWHIFDVSIGTKIRL